VHCFDQRSQLPEPTKCTLVFTYQCYRYRFTCFGVQNTIFRDHVMWSLKPIVSKQATFYGPTVGRLCIVANCCVHLVGLINWLYLIRTVHGMNSLQIIGAQINWINWTQTTAFGTIEKWLFLLTVWFKLGITCSLNMAFWMPKHVERYM
jgi:hypothetical protein